MSSTNKTPVLRLNSWVGSDIPSREDFNRDNSIIDSRISDHEGDLDIHTSMAEKEVWDTPYCFGTYMGNGSGTRNVTADCRFTPTWGLLFAINKFPSIKDFNNTSDYNYFALLSNRGSTVGVTLSGKTLTLIQSGVAVSGSEYRNFNENGVTYVYILFR